MEKKNHPKKIAYLSAAPRVSTRREAELVGPKTHILGVINAFESSGWEVKRYIVGDRVPVDWIKKGSEKEISRSNFRIFLADITRLSLGLINSLRAYRELGSQVDIVYERLAILQSLGWIFKSRGKFWVLETNAPLSTEAKDDRKSIMLARIARYMEHKAYQQCDLLVTVSETLGEIIAEEAGISVEKILVLPNAVDPDRFTPECYKPIRLFEGFTIGFVGGLATWQGLDLLFDVFAELRAEGRDIFLVFVGDGTEREVLEQRTSELKLNDYVRFTGFVNPEEVPKYIAGFDVGYSGQTERTEKRMYCSPIKVYEYMAMGTPAVASDYEDTRRIIEEGTGFLFEIGNREALKRTLIKAYNQKDRLASMGQAARMEILRNHTWSSRVTELIGKLEEFQNKKL